MRSPRPLAAVAALAAALSHGAAAAGLLDGRSYIVEMSSSQATSGFGDYLLPPLVKALGRSRLKPARGPEADLVINVVTASDIGRWKGTGADRAWIHEVSVTVGISPAAHVLPPDGTPAFGVRARLLTPDPDREDELAYLIGLAARTAIANYRATGLFATDGSVCLRR